MNYFANSVYIDELLEAGGAFKEKSKAKIESYLPQAKVIVIQMLEKSINTRYPYGYSGTFFSGRYSGYQYASPSAIVRRVAQDLYDDLQAKPDDEEYGLLARAEALLCLHEAMQIMNLRPTGQGGFTKTLGAKDNMTMLMSAREISAYKRTIYSQAKALVDDVLYRLGHEPRVTYAV